jgi:very-short-patch-repair endonuclease
MTAERRKASPDPRVKRARKLRRNSTDAEARLWHILRDRGIGAKFRRQFPFGPYILDFYCLERRLVIEVDGSQHYEADGLAKDAERTALLEKSGLRMFGSPTSRCCWRQKQWRRASGKLSRGPSWTIPSP